MIRRLCCTGALVLGLLAASVPAASAATVSPSKWAPEFCTALQDWQTTIQEKSDAMTNELQNVDTTGQSPRAILRTTRNKIADFLDDMVDTTKDTAETIKEIGKPSSPNGAKISAVFVAGFNAMAKEFDKAQDKAEALPTGSVAAFRTKGEQLGRALRDSSKTLSRGFSSIGKLDRGKKLEKAVKATPECAFLT